MDNTIQYLNTDLDLKSVEDLTPLADAMAAGGVVPLSVQQCEDGVWHSILETDEAFTEPEPNIAAMLQVIESLPAAIRSVWDRCHLREFNIGYDCGIEPWAFNQALSAEALARIARANASLRITLYPDRSPPK